MEQQNQTFQLNKTEQKIVVAVFVLSVITRLIYIFGVGYFLEDSLITMRYSKNIFQGSGFVYNAGEYVMGATSPLWTLILSPIAGLLPDGASIPVVSLLGLTIYIASFCYLYGIIQLLDVSFLAKSLAVVLICLNYIISSVTVGGMETSLFIFSILSSSYYLISGRLAVAVALAALSTLTRPEGSVLAFAIVLYGMFYHRRLLIKEFLLYYVPIVLPWVVFATLYFGSPIPQSAVAKSSVTHLDQPTLLSIATGFPSAFYYYFTLHSGNTFAKIPRLVQSAIDISYLTLWLVGFVFAVRKKLKFHVFMGVFFFFYTVLYALFSPSYFEWYAVPGILSSSVVVALTAGLLLDGACAGLSQRLRFLQKPVCTYTVIAVVVLLQLAVNAYKINRHDILQNYENTVRRPLGEHLAQTADRDAVVMLEPIGYIGYFSRLRVLDVAGLVSPQFSASFRDKPNWQLDIIKEYLPDYAVFRQGRDGAISFWPSSDLRVVSSARDRIWFNKNYEIDKIFPSDEPGYFGMIVYRKRTTEGE